MHNDWVRVIGVRLCNDLDSSRVQATRGKVYLARTYSNLVCM